MNVKPTHRLPARVWRVAVGGALLATSAMVDHRGLAAPSVIANPAPQPPVETQDQQNTPNEMDVFQPFGQPADNTVPQIFVYGPVQLHPSLDYNFTYGTGVQSAPGNEQNTIIEQISPGLLIDLGPHWVVDYTPTLHIYTGGNFKNGVDQAATLSGSVEYEGWVFSLAHSSQLTSAPLVETASQTDTSTHVTSLSASHALSSNMSADFALNQNITLVSGFQDSYDWNTLDWVNYQFWPRLNAGVGVGGGYVLIEGDNSTVDAGNSDQTYEQLQARVNWRATDKISFQVNGGLEDRQFSTAGTGNSLNPVYGVGVQYAPFPVTQISLNANRTVSSSDYYLAAQQTEATVVSLTVSQRLLRKFNLALSGAYSKTDYDTATGVAAVGAANRSDDLYSFTARLSHPFYKRGTWSLFYQYSENTSSQPGFGYASNQTGFEISYSF